MKVKSFDSGFCSQKQFSKIIGKSPAFVYYLRLIGVVYYCRAGVLILRSLQTYFNSYLPPNRRQAELAAAVARISKFDFIADNDFLKSARHLQQKIDAAKVKLMLLKFFNRLSPVAAPLSLVETAARQLQSLTGELSAAKKRITLAIAAAKFPAAIENVLLRRYVHCESWHEIAESVYSLPYSYTLHRRGRELFQAVAQVAE